MRYLLLTMMFFMNVSVAWAVDYLDKPFLSPIEIEKTPALINFFASWCPACHVEHDTLMALNNIPVYGVAFKDKSLKTKEYLMDKGDPYVRVIEDQSGRLGVSFGLYGTPETYLVNDKQMVVARWRGAINVDEVNKAFAHVLADFPETDPRTMALAVQLRCPVCGGQSVATSNAPMAQAMRDVIFNGYKNGLSEQDIITQLTSRYGTDLLINPFSVTFYKNIGVAMGLVCFVILGIAIFSIRRAIKK